MLVRAAAASPPSSVTRLASSRWLSARNPCDTSSSVFGASTALRFVSTSRRLRSVRSESSRASAGHLQGLGLNFLPAQLDGALRALAIAHDDLAERDLVAAIDRERRGEPEIVRAAAELLLLLLTRQQRERALQLIVVGHERRRLGAGAEPDDRDAVGRATADR